MSRVMSPNDAVDQESPLIQTNLAALHPVRLHITKRTNSTVKRRLLPLPLGVTRRFTVSLTKPTSSQRRNRTQRAYVNGEATRGIICYDIMIPDQPAYLGKFETNNSHLTCLIKSR